MRRYGEKIDLALVGETDDVRYYSQTSVQPHKLLDRLPLKPYEKRLRSEKV
jgi:hypothetical protein